MLSQKRVGEAAPFRAIATRACCRPLQQRVQHDALHAREPAGKTKILDCRLADGTRRADRPIRHVLGFGCGVVRTTQRAIGEGPVSALLLPATARFRCRPGDEATGIMRTLEAGAGCVASAMRRSNPSHPAASRVAFRRSRELAILLELDGREEMQLVDGARAGHIQQPLLFLLQPPQRLLADPIVKPRIVTVLVANRSQQQLILRCSGAACAPATERAGNRRSCPVLWSCGTRTTSNSSPFALWMVISCTPQLSETLGSGCAYSSSSRWFRLSSRVPKQLGGICASVAKNASHWRATPHRERAARQVHATCAPAIAPVRQASRQALQRHRQPVPVPEWTARATRAFGSPGRAGLDASE